ncbi:MAG TPA: hypothetical protein VHZ54_04160 [Solirubrobacterales bacterium]|nr:hypothetical protein [Solirubrobacterales bacterium]
MTGRRARRALLVSLAVGACAPAFAASALGFFAGKGTGEFQAPIGVLTIPTITAARVAAGGTVALSWKAAEGPSGAIAYFVTRDGGTPGGDCPTQAEPQNEATSCTDEGLGPGTYNYVVTAVWRSWRAVSATSQAKVQIGVATHFTVVVSSTTPAAGAADNLTITAKDSADTAVTSYTGNHELVFSGAEVSPGGNEPTVAATGGAAEPFGEATKISFTSGVAKVSGTKNGVLKVYDAGTATIAAGDGTIETESPPTVTVSPGAKSKLALGAATTTPVAGATDALTVTAIDTYGNTATTFTGSKNLTFSGASASAGGDSPTVTNSSGALVAFGSTTALTFSAGATTVNGKKNGVMTLYKAAAANLKVTEGSTASAALAVTTTAAEPAELTVSATSTKPIAGATDNLKTTAFDTYGNIATQWEGTHSIIFSGAEPSPSGTAPTVIDGEGAAVEFGEPVALQFTAGVASVSGGANGVMTLTRTGATTVSATGDGIEAPDTVAVTVAAGSAANLAWTEPKISAGSLGTPCLFSCTVTKLGNGGTFVAKVAVTDALGNVVENLGSGHSAKVTASGGTVTGATLTIATKGAAVSETTFTYKAPASGTFTNTITAARSAGTTYTSATAITSR